MPKRTSVIMVSIVLSAIAAVAGSGTWTPAWAQSGSRGSGRAARPDHPRRSTSTAAGRYRAANPAVARTAAPSAADAPLAMEGYCPVCLQEMKKWVKGNPAYSAVYDGRKYLFPSDKQRQMFLANPQRYVPVLNGDCVVCFAKMHERVPGNIRYGAFHGGRVYFFASQEQKQMFMSDPGAYANADLALGGECPVCRVEMRQRTPGQPDVSLVYDGLRYRFGSQEHRKMFQDNPEKYRAAPQAAAGSGGTRQHAPHARGSGSASRPAAPPRGSSGR